MMKPTHIPLLVTGGTIDSVFDITQDTNVVMDHSVIREYIDSSIRPHFSISQEIVTLKDSRQITDHVREDIIHAICRVPHQNIILTHGTYTLVATAQYLQKNISKYPNKKIVLTGSFYPLKGFSDTDAPFNLGFAIASSLLLAPGIYVAMNGGIFNPDQVSKNIQEGRFENL
jgi:L-asparaginase